MMDCAAIKIIFSNLDNTHNGSPEIQRIFAECANIVLLYYYKHYTWFNLYNTVHRPRFNIESRV